MRRITCMAMFFLIALARSGYGGELLVEAESFTQRGGWKLDTQFIQILNRHL